ncbi:MAG TPA: SPOR domain-containing protein, partial [Xanthobacteraceae bacterium]|nr:SPOR domain-containing protein [Xanthobacteraceae bacterium]
YEQDYASDDYQDEYAEPARDKRRWMLLSVVSLIGLVVLGVSGIYGYRAIFKKHTASNPPTIRSAETPAKVAPTAAQAKPEGAKQNYDRIGEMPPAGGERVVSREEQPAISAGPGARTVTTTAVGAQTGNSVSAFAAPSQAPALTPPPSTVNHGNGEPRRVRTLTVRADGTIVDPRHSQATPARANAPLALNGNAHEAADEPTHAARGATHQANAAPSRTANYVPAGSYVVQVSSQKSEQDAQTAWRQLQAKYTNVLGNAQVSFKRVDLGDRGTFYRAMVGPFANRDQAYEMCQNLKTAGGECVVQRN